MESGNSADDWEPTGPQEYAKLLTAVFGDSDTDEDSKDHDCTVAEIGVGLDEEYFWGKVEEVEGLWHCSNFLSTKQQQSLLEAIESEGWFCDPLHNQAMRFGDLPGWAKDLSALIQSRSGALGGVKDRESSQYSEIDESDEVRDRSSPFPSQILGRKPFFDQMIVNMYQPGEGIAAHVDLLRFEDGIAIVSLESTCVMSFQPVDMTFNGVEDIRTKEPVLDPRYDSNPAHGTCASNTKVVPYSRSPLCKQLETSHASRFESQSHICELDARSGAPTRVDVLLNPGDLIIAYGPARYDWTHEINRGEGHQLWKGKPIVQQRRVSVTLRRLCSQKDV